jgi:hypothetical protein
MAEAPKKDTFIDDCVLFSLAQQGVVATLVSTILDGGQLFQCAGFAAACAYWVAHYLISGRRADRLTRLDRLFLRWGFLMLCVVSFFLVLWTWALLRTAGPE